MTVGLYREHRRSRQRVGEVSSAESGVGGTALARGGSTPYHAAFAPFTSLEADMLRDPRSRRDFLRATGAAAAGGWLAVGLAGCRDALHSSRDTIAQGGAPRVLSEAEMRAFDALADRIIPADGDAPGASAARAVVFVDHYAAARPEVLERVRALLGFLDPRFPEMAEAERDDVLRGLERDRPDLLGFACFLTALGTLSDPSLGGNQDRAGWRMIGFEDRHAWEPPFGAYDAAVAQEGDA